MAALNLFFPIYCQGCDIKLPYNNKTYLCNACVRKVKQRPPPPYINKRRYFQRAWQCCAYEGLIRDLIHRFKYNKKLFLKNIFVELMSDFLTSNADYNMIDAIIPVPMHKSDIAKRGFNHAAVLAEGLSKKLGIPLLDEHLVKIRRTKEQIRLNRKERASNTKDAFSVKNVDGLRGKALLLADDVFTTGATADACSKVLMASGAEKVWVLALARGRS